VIHNRLRNPEASFGPGYPWNEAVLLRSDSKSVSTYKIGQRVKRPAKEVSFSSGMLGASAGVVCIPTYRSFYPQEVHKNHNMDMVARTWVPLDSDIRFRNSASSGQFSM
jgi:hypothetical protein